MDLLLWRWSTVVQFTSLVMVAGFFLVLARTSPRSEVRSWVLAWLANTTSLALAAYFWVAQPTQGFGWLLGGYMGFKLAFVLWLLQGAWAVGRPGTVGLSLRTIITTASSYAFLCGLFIPSIPIVGIVQHLTMGVLLLGGALALGRQWRAIAWLSTGLCLRGVSPWPRPRRTGWNWTRRAASRPICANRPRGCWRPRRRSTPAWSGSLPWGVSWRSRSERSVSWRLPTATCCWHRKTCAGWRIAIR
jgi:hypothetical protein